MKTNKIIVQPVGSLYGAPGHHNYFLTNLKTREMIGSFSRFIQTEGMEAFLTREYPPDATKKIIINQIGGKFYVVDGNKHLISILLVKPDLKLGELLQYDSGIIRFWHRGIEAMQNTGIPYEIFIPNHIDTSAISGARAGYDYFKSPPEAIQIIPASIPFDSPAFQPEDRGKPLQLTAAKLRNFNLSTV